MKRILLALVLCLSIATLSSAQGVEAGSSKKDLGTTLLPYTQPKVVETSIPPMLSITPDIGYRTNFKHSRTRDNWFVSVSGGLSVLYGDQTYKAGLSKQLNFAPSLSFGKWFNPYVGFRVQLNGGQLKNYIYGYYDARSNGIVNTKDIREIKQDGNYGAVHADLMLDVINMWAPYDAKRTLHVMPWIGMGYARQFKSYFSEDNIPYLYGSLAPHKVDFNVGYYYPHTESPTMNAGVIAAVRLNNYMDLHAEVQGALLNETFNSVSGGAVSDGIVQASVGLTFKLRKMVFESMDAREAMHLALLDALNNHVNALRAENEALKRRPIDCPELVTVEEIYKADNVIYFSLNSSKIESSQQLILFNTAEFIKANNLSIKVVGYADKNTGTPPYNKALSERRARTVAKELVGRYHISPDRISIEWRGDTEQPYSVNAWNRVVLIREDKQNK